MLNEPLQRLFDLVKKTGDRLVVYDRQSGDTFVLLDIDVYQTLLKRQNLNGKEHRVKDMESAIAQDLALWERTKLEVMGKVKPMPEQPGQSDSGEESLPVVEENQDKYYFEEVDSESEKSA